MWPGARSGKAPRPTGKCVLTAEAGVLLHEILGDRERAAEMAWWGEVKGRIGSLTRMSQTCRVKRSSNGWQQEVRRKRLVPAGCRPASNGKTEAGVA